MNDLREWTATLCADLGIDDEQFDYPLVLAMARDAERAATKPAGPITVYLIGMAVAQGLSPAEAAAKLDALAQRWTRIDWRD
ncbi:DUF6457 domain-containing protein [Saccharomonospora sp. NPDC006951]